MFYNFFILFPASNSPAMVLKAVIATADAIFKHGDGPYELSMSLTNPSLISLWRKLEAASFHEPDLNPAPGIYRPPPPGGWGGTKQPQMAACHCIRVPAPWLKSLREVSPDAHFCAVYMNWHTVPSPISPVYPCCIVTMSLVGNQVCHRTLHWREGGVLKAFGAFIILCPWITKSQAFYM